MGKSYLFRSKRLGFRNWHIDDLPHLAELNANKEAMHYFPTTMTLPESEAFLNKMMSKYETVGYCYFAVEELSSKKLIGMIGLSDKSFEAEFTPCIDIGWRLSPTFWGKGYATEGALKCLEYAFKHHKLEKIVAIAPVANQASIKIMEKIGMLKLLDFKHPQLIEYKKLVHCVCYEIYNNA